jgi:hypothetical protein
MMLICIYSVSLQLKQEQSRQNLKVLTMVYNQTSDFLDFVHRPEFQTLKNTTFRKLILLKSFTLPPTKRIPNPAGYLQLGQGDSNKLESVMNLLKVT